MNIFFDSLVVDTGIVHKLLQELPSQKSVKNIGGNMHYF